MNCSKQFLFLAVAVWLALSSDSVWSQANPQLLDVEDFIHNGSCETEDGFMLAGEIISLAKREGAIWLMRRLSLRNTVFQLL